MDYAVPFMQKQAVANPDLPDTTQYLTFKLGQEIFAIELLKIREIIEFSSLTAVPMMPPFIRGVLNLRGAVVPVVDLAIRFGRTQTPAPIASRSCVIILEIPFEDTLHPLGIIVDAVDEVLEFRAEDIGSAPSFGTQLRADFIAGMGRYGEGFVIILSPEQVLSITEMAALFTQQVAV